VPIGRVLDRLQREDTWLAKIAASFGFADQAHLSRMVRDHVGQTPAELRRAFAAQRSD
jgi:transcriptional regulator GlxA family with amidase domain